LYELKRFVWFALKKDRNIKWLVAQSGEGGDFEDEH
jgi:hypothetical protein